MHENIYIYTYVCGATYNKNTFMNPCMNIYVRDTQSDIIHLTMRMAQSKQVLTCSCIRISYPILRHGMCTADLMLPETNAYAQVHTCLHHNGYAFITAFYPARQSLS